MPNPTGSRTDADPARKVAYWTFGVQDLDQRTEGKPFDNRNSIYAGAYPANPARDFELNAGVRRYASSPCAVAKLVHHHTPTGRRGQPMLPAHTIYDPVVPMRQRELYQDEVGHILDQMVRRAERGPLPAH